MFFEVLHGHRGEVKELVRDLVRGDLAGAAHVGRLLDVAEDPVDLVQDLERIIMQACKRAWTLDS